VGITLGLREVQGRKGMWQETTTTTKYEGWNFNSGNYLFTTDTK